MNEERRPVCRKGKRNPFCPFYGLCLDEAVKNSWAFWDCSECENESNRDARMDADPSMSGNSVEIHDLPSGMDDMA